VNTGATAVLRRGLGLAAATTMLLLIGAGGASAADGTIVSVERTDAGLELSVDVPADVTLDLAGVTATVEGLSYEATATRIADGDSLVQRTTILAIDTSDSMAGERFTAAKAAATTFLDTVPDDVAVGIVTFDSTVATRLDPTTDRDTARGVINRLELSRETLLYDGVLQAVDLAGDTGQRSVLVLSDGADTGDTLIADVVSAVSESGVVVDVVALEQSGGALVALRQLAGTEGDVISADSAALAAAFSAEAAVLARQVGVTIAVPSDIVVDQLSIVVTLPSDAGNVVAQSTIPGTEDAAPPAGIDLGAIPAAPAPGESRDLPRGFMIAAVGVFAVGLLLGLVMLVPRKPTPMSAEERVSTYTSGGLGASTDKAASEPPLAQATEAMAGVLRRNRKLDDRITKRLEGAGSEFKSSEWLLVHAGIFLAVTVVGLLIGRGNVVIGLSFMLGGAFGPWVYLGFRRSRRRKAFDSGLPETLQLISGSLSAGLSLMQSVDTIVREGTEPVASEFKRVLVETRIGISLEDALDGVAERFDSRDFRWVVMAIKIQRQVGGNLAELLNTVAGTMREREYIRRQVGALAAEGKLSAAVLGALPPGFLVYLALAQPDYVAPLFNDIRGIIMLVGGTLWLGVGIFWMSRLIKVEV